MRPFHEKVDCQVCEISHSRHLKYAKEIVDKEEERGIIKKLNEETDSQVKTSSQPVTITKLREQSHKRFIVPSEPSVNQGSQCTNLSLSQFPLLQSFNKDASFSRKTTDSLPSTSTLMEVDQNTKMGKTVFLEVPSVEKSAFSRINHPKSPLKSTTSHRKSPSQSSAMPACSSRVSETPTIPQEALDEFLEDIEMEKANENKVILVENKDETSLDVSRLCFSSDSITGSKWSMRIHDIDIA